VFTVCHNDPCKCIAAGGDVDACECEPADAAVLVDGVPCAKCGAPLDAVDEPPIDPHAPRLRRVVFGLGRKIIPAGRREIWSSPPAMQTMRLERFVINGRPAARFSLDVHAAIVGGFRIDYGFPVRFDGRGCVGGEFGAWFDPTGRHGGIHLEAGGVLELEVENPGQRSVDAAAAGIGIALMLPDAAAG